ncbi:MAG: D-glycero-beta-D-manno-heptose 1-phosphate adenylyltransferase [Chlamydiae bacterium]|nr:D-glycero-beta-D-manno-heptose 1-phosphate adenylyltransferase [Chlamydiota bacterium]
MSSKLHSTTQTIDVSKWHPALRRKVLAPDTLAESIASLREQNKRLITLNGSFDLPHAGHLEMLSQAFDLKGDNGVVLVALNTDASIRRYKSTDRPIINLEGRVKMMASFLFVDYVTWFDQDDPRELLEICRPDIHVNGSEYGSNCIEANTVREGGGNLFIVEKLEGLSTSSIIQKIMSLGKKIG